MSENTGGTPPRDDDDPIVPPPPPAYGQPAGEVPPPSPQPGAAPPPPGGTYPPPAYGTPPGAGGYPPPASPYGQAPYGQAPYGQPGQQPYGQQPYSPPPGQVDIGAGFSWSFSKFGQNWATFVLGGLAWFVVIAVIAVIGVGLIGGAAALTDNDGIAAGIGASIGIAIYVGLMILLLVLFSAAYLKVALKVADGRPVSVGDLFDTSHAGQLVLLALLIGLAGLVASLIPIIGQIAFVVVGFFVFYAVVAIVDRNESAVDAIRTSIRLQTKDLGTGILVYLVVAVVSWVGSALCGVGLLVSLPVGALLTVFAYRRLTGGQVAA